MSIFALNMQENVMSEKTTRRFLPDCLKSLREEAKLPQRKVAAAIDLDTATYSKIENGKYIPNKKQVENIADFYGTNRTELVKLWMADKFLEIAELDDAIAEDAIRLLLK